MSIPKCHLNVFTYQTKSWLRQMASSQLTYLKSELLRENPPALKYQSNAYNG